MLEVLHLREADARVVPWKNARGVTRELALWPAGARFESLDFDWRISTAVVEEDGPFSRFPGVERTLVVTQGDGLVLSHGADGPRARVRALEPYRFSGEWETRAELTRGPIADLNVMVRAGRVRASVEALVLGERRTRESLAAGHAFLHVVRGGSGVRVTNEEEVVELDVGESLWLRGLRGDEELELVGRASSALVLVALRSCS